MLDISRGIEPPVPICPEQEKQKTFTKIQYAKKICEFFESRGFEIKSSLIQSHGHSVDLNDWQVDFLSEDILVFYSLSTHNHTVIDFNISHTSGDQFQDIIIPFSPTNGDQLFLNIYHYVPKNNQQFYPLLQKLKQELLSYIDTIEILSTTTEIEDTKSKVLTVLS